MFPQSQETQHVISGHRLRRGVLPGKNLTIELKKQKPSSSPMVAVATHTTNASEARTARIAHTDDTYPPTVVHSLTPHTIFPAPRHAIDWLCSPPRAAVAIASANPGSSSFSSRLLSLLARAVEIIVVKSARHVFASSSYSFAQTPS